MSDSLFSRGFSYRRAAQDTPPAEMSRKWNPGIYIGAKSTSTAIFSQMMTRLAAVSQYKGVLVRYTWRDLEGAEGDYSAGFDLIDNHLAQIAAYPGKRYIAFLQLKTFYASGGGKVVPDYMTGSAYNDATGILSDDGLGNMDGIAYTVNGQYEYYTSFLSGIGGAIPAMYMPAVQARLTALLDAYGARYNTNPNFEAFGFSELSMGRPFNVSVADPYPSPWVGQVPWLDGFETGVVDALPSWDKTYLVPWINAPRAGMEAFVPSITANTGIGLGMPDLCIEEGEFQFYRGNPDYVGAYSLNGAPGNIWHMQQIETSGMRMGHFSREAMLHTYVSELWATRAGYANLAATPYATRQQIHDFGVNTCKCSHLILGHDTATDPNYGVTYNTESDRWIQDVASDITVSETRPVGW